LIQEPSAAALLQGSARLQVPKV